MKMTGKQKKALQEAAQPLIEWMRRNSDAPSYAVVNAKSVELCLTVRFEAREHVKG